MSSAKNITYRVEITERATRDLDGIYDYIEAEDSEGALRWYEGLEALFLTLRREPQRGLRTPEDKKLFHLLYGNKPHVYRIIYRIHRTERRVVIVHIRHGARSPFQSNELIS